jgi:RNA polymerase sigma-70 factor (ECF subfamily)
MSAPIHLLDEERWVRAARQGDVEAFNQLVERYESAAYNVALRAIGSADDAADATQDAFISAYRAMGEFRGGSFKSWLLRIVLNACHDISRRQRRRPATSMDAIVEEIGEAPWEDPDAPDPETMLLSHEMRGVIEQVLAGLPEEQRIAVTLVDMQELSYEEAAEAMGCAVGTIRSRLARGRARLRDRLLASGNLK